MGHASKGCASNGKTSNGRAAPVVAKGDGCVGAPLGNGDTSCTRCAAGQRQRSETASRAAGEGGTAGGGGGEAADQSIFDASLRGTNGEHRLRDVVGAAKCDVHPESCWHHACAKSRANGNFVGTSLAAGQSRFISALESRAFPA